MILAFSKGHYAISQNNQKTIKRYKSNPYITRAFDDNISLFSCTLKESETIKDRVAVAINDLPSISKIIDIDNGVLLTEGAPKAPKRDLEIDLYRKINDLDDYQVFAYMSQDIHQEYTCIIDLLVHDNELNGSNSIRNNPRFQQTYAYIQCYFDCGGESACVNLLSAKAINRMIDNTESDSYLNTRYRIYQMILACDKIEREIASKLRHSQCYNGMLHD